jgi:maltooligosyltrehalose trehalohydrolase
MDFRTLTKADWQLDLGASFRSGKLQFRVWTPKAREVAVKIVTSGKEHILPLSGAPNGYFTAFADGLSAGDRYFYVLDGMRQYPDPASRFQPEGVHGPSEVVDPGAFDWHDDGWKGKAEEDFIIYELHAGTFTEEGTFDAIITRLDYLVELGITAIDIMPVAQFPGPRNWGYDGAYPFAPQNSYGGPDGLKILVDSCHSRGLSVILDVVYNHLGPEGNYLENYGHYFTDKYRTPWGKAVNFDGPYSDEVRRFFIDNALYWLTEYHFDALRLDAVHGIFDFSARHFLSELADAVHHLKKVSGRNVHIIAESDLNDVRLIKAHKAGGYGLDALWNDDFHHSLHTLITGEDKGYYQDFGEIGHMGKALREGFVYTGQYSKFRKRRHGSISKAIPPNKFIVCSQNHDQVGNRMTGDRLSQTQSLQKLKLCAATVILSPHIPFLFMGEEYGETSPFQYFISHTDSNLIENVRKGRREEFAAFGWLKELPDPQAESTFLNSKLRIEQHEHGDHKILFEFYRKLLRLRKEIPLLNRVDKKRMEVTTLEAEKVLMVKRWDSDNEVLSIASFNEKRVYIPWQLQGVWDKVVESSSTPESGNGEPSTATEHDDTGNLLSIAPFSFVLYRKRNGQAKSEILEEG